MGNCFPSKEERPTKTTRNILTTESDEYTKDLIEACSCGDAMLVTELLSNGANPSAIDPDTNGTALMIAATVGQAYCLELLIEAGAIVDQKHPDFGMTALLWACNNAHVRCVELLIEAGADKKSTEIAGLTGRELATENMRFGWEEVVDLMTDEGDDSLDFEAERAMSAARTKRMAKIVGDDAHSSLSFLQTSEQLDKGPAKPKSMSLLESTHQDAAKKSIDALINADEQKPQFNKKKSMKDITSKAVHYVKDEQQTTKYLEHWGANTEVRDMVVELLRTAKAKDKTVTPLLARTADACNGKMYGLDFRIKALPSLARKVLEKSKGDESKLKETLEKQNDALRYTVLFETDAYVNGAKAIEAALTQERCTVVKMKNFWRKPGESTDYMGINAVFRTDDGFPFEVQFHTPESIDTKMQRCHHSYEKFREDHSMAKAQYWEEMARMWSLVPIPPGVLSIGEQVVHKVAIDEALQQLTQAERDVLARKKQIEDVVIPKCEIVIGHALRAEGSVTPILISVAEECGISLHGLDFRVKSALSMCRKVVAKLYDRNKTHLDLDAIEADIWCEQRQALRYTLVCNEESYVHDVRKAFRGLNSAGFMEEFVWNYWKDAEPYNVIRSRLWSESMQTWCFLVFHTRSSLELSEARLQEYQKTIGMVFHTATFQEGDKLEEAVERLKSDDKWRERVAALPVPPAAETIGKLIQSEERAGVYDVLSKPSASTQQLLAAGTVNKVLKTVLGIDIAQALADAAASEDQGLIQLAIEKYEESASLLRVLVEEEDISDKKRNIANAELFECEEKQETLKKQLASVKSQGDGGVTNVFSTKTTSAAITSYLTAADITTSTARAGKDLAKGTARVLMNPTNIVKEGASLSRALRHNVLTDSLGASTKLFMRNPQNEAVIDEVKLKVIWESLDDDSSGYLDKREMMEVLRQMGKNRTSKQRLDRIFRQIDKDKDGTIDYEEFLAWWKKQKKSDRATLENRVSLKLKRELSNPLSEDHEGDINFSNPASSSEDFERD